MTPARRSRAVLALSVNNWPSRGYLAAVVLTAGFAVYDYLFVTHPDASMAFVVPTLLTLPLSLPFVVALDGLPTGAPVCLGIAVGAFANAVVLGAAVRAVRGRGPSSARPA